MNLLSPKAGRAELTAAHLRLWLEQGRWIAELPGEHALSSMLGVSRPTLRNALRQLEKDGWIKRKQGKKTKILIRHTEEPKSHKPNTVGLIISNELINSSSTVLFYISELRIHLQASGHDLDIFPLPGGRGKVLHKALEDWAELQHIVVWVLHSTPHAVHAWGTKVGQPAIISGTPRQSIQLPSIDVDQKAVACHATGILLSRGHQKIAFQMPNTPLGGQLKGIEGYRQALKNHQNAILKPCIISTPSSPDLLKTTFKALLTQKGRPSAIILWGLQDALSFWSVSASLGFRVPDEISLIVMEYSNEFRYLDPPLASYSHSKSRFSKRLSELIIRLIHCQKLAKKRYHLPSDYFSGGSVARHSSTI